MTTARRALAALRLPPLEGRRRWAALPTGCVVTGAGAALLLATGLGMPPYDVLITGIAAQAGISFGTASVPLSAVFALTGWGLGGPVGPGTPVTVLLIGPAVDAWLWLLPTLAEGLASRLAVFAVGLVVLAFGLSLIIASSLGPGPVELVMLGLSRRGVPLRWARTGLEATVLLAGWALGGALGVGTLVVMLLIGHLFAVFVPLEAQRRRVPR